MQDCIFCRIVNREIPADVVYEDEHLLAFKDINPVAPVHLLFIPKRHIPTLFDLQDGDERLLGLLQKAAVQVARDLGLEERGFRLVTNCQEDGGQYVFHVHYHLLAGRELNWPPG
ncbi:histidine triad nucleotide-binding protein [Candidatus Desulforudis audaxviator]|uniref:Histidine triad (HIT) protein n=1 Tax=Desulforudis audaxviator (strain MP104C) TaxID=477974 RepID=B1I694_DESAP|nr:histidine triad nucleotide-binding protein [Candidatus Desulforudis audaxviator]ACA60542.1 histidine triad (HIT) protein [Candidatus Desulforudis audaxviator MP104C]AZK60613.1 HIT family hydrolase [Candidatus Desulforudis audaxviator]